MYDVTVCLTNNCNTHITQYLKEVTRRRTTSNQRWNNVAYVNVEIYNIQQRWNNVVVFNVDFHNIGQRRNNVANMTISKKKQISLDSKAK